MKKLLVAGSVLAFTAAAGAAQLGTLSVSSKLNEPMKALLEVKDVPADGSGVSVGLASRVVYQSLGKTYADDLRDITVTLVSVSPYRLRLESTQPVKTADFPIILVLDDDGRRAAKLYNLHFAPRTGARPVQETTTSAQSAAAAAPRQTAERTADAARPKLAVIPSAASPAVPSASVRAQKPVAAEQTEKKSFRDTINETIKETARETVPSAKPAVKQTASSVKPAVKETVKPLAAAKTDVKAAAQKTQDAVKAQVPAKTQAAAKAVQTKAAPVAAKQAVKKAAAAPAETVNIRLKGKRETVEVKQGITLWSTVKSYVSRYPGASTQQLIVQTIRDNPSCFEGGKSSSVIRGCRMVLPQRITVSKADALFYVNEHPDWDATKSVAEQIEAHSSARALPAAPVPAPAVKAAEEKPAAAPSEKKAEPVVQPEIKTEPVPQAEPAVKQEKQPAEPVKAVSEQAAPAQKAQAASSEPEKKAQPEQKPAQQAKSTDDSGSPFAWILGLVLALLAAIGVGYNMIKRRKAQTAEAEKTSPVEFREPEPTSKEQLDGAAKMVENRIEADEAAARGFPQSAKAEPAKTEQAEQSPTFPTAPEGMVEVQSEQSLLAKIDQARAYMAVGANAKAVKQLEEVIKNSSGKIQQTASDLMAMLESKK